MPFGPAISSREVFLELVKAGLDVVRFNFSHGSYEDHLKGFQLVREINKEFNLSNQLIRSATSINANLHEARSSESLKDYTHKVFIAFKESRETHSWLTLLKETEYISESEYSELHKEINGISSTHYAITTAMRKKLEAQKREK